LDFSPHWLWHVPGNRGLVFQAKGQTPAAVVGGVGSAEWRDLVMAFILAAVSFLGQQILAPMQASLGELPARRIDGHVY
jgi:hypothetical protein